MQIKFLHIKNFKSIQELKITDIENSLILVGKNNTGKTAVLDAIRLATGSYEVEERNFNEKKQKDLPKDAARYEALTTGSGNGKASDCIKCGKCEKECPQYLKIRELLDKVAAEFEEN